MSGKEGSGSLLTDVIIINPWKSETGKSLKGSQA